MIRIEYKNVMSEAALAANKASTAIDISLMSGYSFQCSYVDGGAFAGTIKVQGSNDGTIFTDIPSSSVAISVANGNFFNYDGAFYRYARVFVTVTAGVAAVTIVANSKGLA